MNKKRILITGEKGMIGKMLVDNLSLLTDACVVINKEYERNFAIGLESNNLYTNANNVVLRDNEINILSTNYLEFLLKYKPDIIINCAGLVGTDFCEKNPFYASYINEAGMYYLIRNVKEYNRNAYNETRVIHFSTTAIYDPDCYERAGYILENSHFGPKTIYGISKLGGELVVKSYFPDDLRIIVRPCFIYGNDEEHSVISKMATWRKEDLIFGACEFEHREIFLDPRKFKDYLFVDDFIDLMKMIIFCDETSIWGREYNISLGAPRLFNDVIKIFEKFGFKENRYMLFPHKDYLGNHVVDNSLIRKTFPLWKPKYNIESGIQKLIGLSK